MMEKRKAVMWKEAAMPSTMPSGAMPSCTVYRRTAYRGAVYRRAMPCATAAVPSAAA
jgi:hypothetical protein